MVGRMHDSIAGGDLGHHLFGDTAMPDLLHLRRHRFDALHALLAGARRRKTPETFIENNHLRRDIGLNEVAKGSTPKSLAAPMVGLRR